MAEREYKGGDYFVRCQRTGFKLLRSECVHEWNGLLVRRESHEGRQPQDFVRGRPDRQAAEDPSPDYTEDYFLTATEVTADSL